MRISARTATWNLRQQAESHLSRKRIAPPKPQEQTITAQARYFENLTAYIMYRRGHLR